MTFRVDEAPGYIIARTAVMLRNELNRRLKPFEMTTEQWSALNRLWERDMVTQKELSARIEKDQPNTGRILDKLEAKGLVARHPNPADRRVYLIAITDDGRAHREKVAPVVEGMNRDLFAGLTAAELSGLKEFLRRVQRTVESTGEIKQDGGR